jgi:hypothetical protein
VRDSRFNLNREENPVEVLRLGGRRSKVSPRRK